MSRPSWKVANEMCSKQFPSNLEVVASEDNSTTANTASPYEKCYKVFNMHKVSFAQNKG